jgi:hypothetical protein
MMQPEGSGMVQEAVVPPPEPLQVQVEVVPLSTRLPTEPTAQPGIASAGAGARTAPSTRAASAIPSSEKPPDLLEPAIWSLRK